MTVGKSINKNENTEKINKILDDVKKFLTEEEEHLSASTQRRPLFNIKPHTIVVTNRRIIKHMPRLFSTTFQDFMWWDLKNVHMRETLFGAHLLFEFKDILMEIKFLPKEQAKEIYRIAQKQEEEWVGKRRELEYEKLRAQSGAQRIVIGEGGISTTSKAPVKNGVKQKLIDLKSLFDEGILTEEEYKQKKDVLLKDL